MPRAIDDHNQRVQFTLLPCNVPDLGALPLVVRQGLIKYQVLDLANDLIDIALQYDKAYRVASFSALGRSTTLPENPYRYEVELALRKEGESKYADKVPQSFRGPLDKWNNCSMADGVVYKQLERLLKPIGYRIRWYLVYLRPNIIITSSATPDLDLPRRLILVVQDNAGSLEDATVSDTTFEQFGLYHTGGIVRPKF
ncbi:hypothetical protein BDV96DRAFT_688822 [Lophiotrema nucula]|uniref:Uncharacterized protein n=1 Tax=Lophiotrema nucula TaxID=690887 RepID=A0A6A5Z1F2_9PLEO|nr:hypothetical protein BDV96DRAFT_688822 [Lophiotrema nucula]